MTESVKPSDLLREGWIQGCLWEKPAGRAKSFCILGALAECIPSHSFERVCDKIDAHLISRGYESGVMAFNDSPGRTQAEVVELLESCGL